MDQRPSPTESREGGFTLLEVLLAIALLAIALPILLGLRNFDLTLQAKAAELTTATLLVQEKLLEAEMLEYYPVGETTGDFLSTPLGAPSTVHVVDRAIGYKWKRTITTTPLELIKEIRITVSWFHGEIEESVEVSTYVFVFPKFPGLHSRS
jgi:general secretion pathway protein I